MFDLATAAVEAALAAGARYADARIMIVRYESMSAKNRVIEGFTQSEAAGIGVRALIGSSWGFQATPELTAVAARRAGERAAEVARASARVSGAPIDLSPLDPVVASWATPYEVHPLDGVGIGERADLLVEATGAIADGGVPLAQASHQIWDTAKWFASSEGSRIDQHLVDRCHRHRRRRDAAPQLPRRAGPVRHPRVGARPRAGPGGQRPPHRRGGPGPAQRAPVP